MAIRVALNHVTHYKYDQLVTFSPHVVRLRPAPHCRTPITGYSLRVTPGDHFINWQQDPFGNYQARLVFPKPAYEFRVEVDLIAEMTTINPFDFFMDESVEKVPFAYSPELLHELGPYVELSAGGPKLAALAARVRDDIARPGRRTIDVMVEVNQLVQRLLRYDIRMEPGVFPPDETLSRGHGSCRDFSWLLVQLLRRLGFATRFASGYSIQLKADVRSLDGPSGVAEDVTDLHAWAEVFLPGAGWVGLDPTSGLLCGEGHIPLACTPDPGSAAPITGSFSWDKKGEDDEIGHDFKFVMSVRRIDDPPRPTKPYGEEAWRAIVACGDAVDEALVEGDVRLTMGGEPTFVSIDNREGEEWNTTAVGPTKGKLADELLRRLARRFAPGALLHHGQGKWYPGEPLPRWAYNCYFRRDGEPVWRDPSLFAKEPSEASATEPATESHARAFAEALCRHLGVDPRFLVPGYEDAFYYLWREGRLPSNVDPFDSRLENETERAGLRRVFQQGLKHVVGLALPLQSVYSGVDGFRWTSGRWFLRDERMYLVPGDSAMGYRLPLGSLPWVAPGDRNDVVERDPLEPREPLPRRQSISRAAPLRGAPPTSPTGVATPTEPATRPERGRSAAGLVRTALCIEPRGGMLHVFMPPASTLEEYLDLIAAVEDAATELRQPLRVEGYTPPSDHRLTHFSVTPDPGVMEVNIHPAHNWKDLVRNTEILYDEARQTRLGTDKFMLDGRHTGTGGGNHVVLGGATPADSPFLRRPDLLQSLLGYWLNHPSLSYLFSGLFIGPTSQAPRVDEARHDSIYELEIAFRKLKESAAEREASPWLVDRSFRNLLVDVTGNTHRTEMCIDKMYSPDSASGRQGLLELRAFEMPPHARMSAAQQLLVRALVSWFWREPYTRPPVRWGTSLNDRFMLPHYVVDDFSDVIDDLRRAGIPMEQSWFDPHVEFRFPVYGRSQVRGLELELRQALEPWHVMGEEGAAGGAVRYVDSSVERVQLRVRGATDDRHVITCNGRRVPLASTGGREDHVAGVRFRAWHQPSALHPTIPPHTPLVFDVIDTWAGRSIGGLTYHVAHPGGRAHDIFPANALEAEGRRLARFFSFGHTPGSIATPPPEPNPEFPHTLDLRR
jgi:uncharacterized protein (DUF2126 family)/transglutaminase-like putative cysteine protease